MVIRASNLDDSHMAGAIRHLVAAAVPGMTIDEVTVLSTDGTVLASGDDATNAAPTKMLDLEKVIDRNVGGEHPPHPHALARRPRTSRCP